VQDIYYDKGELYQRAPEEEAEENGTKYVKEIINIYFDLNTTDERISEILADFGAERVGEVNDIAMVQARFEAENLDKLNEICTKLEEYDEVIGAGVDTQKIEKDGPAFLSARYMLEGTDADNNPCRLYIENNGSDFDNCTPTIYASSPLLADWETSPLKAKVIPCEGGVMIEIYKL
jgi:hypothetical protein